MQLLKDQMADIEYAMDNMKGLFRFDKEEKKNRELVLFVVTKQGLALQYASDELQNDREIVLAAVTNVGYALHLANDELQNDREIVLAAVTNGRPVSLAICFATFLSYSGGVLIPVPTAVPPKANSLKCASELLIAFNPWSNCET